MASNRNDFDVLNCNELTIQSKSQSLTPTPINCQMFMTLAGATGGRAHFSNTASVLTGPWCNALKGRMTFDTGGQTIGLASAINAEIDLPDLAFTSGSYFALELNVNPGASTTMSALQKAGFITMSVNTNTADFLTNGYVLDLQGLGTATAGKIFDEIGSTTATHELRIRIGTTDYYIMLQQTP